MSGHFNCHIFFPYLPIKHEGEPYLSHEEQELWFDEVIIPSVQGVLTADMLQVEAEIAKHDRTGWFNRTRWPEHLADRNMKHLVYASRLPDQDEKTFRRAV